MNEAIWTMLGAVVVAIIAAIQSARLASHERPIKKKAADAVAATSIAGVEGVYGELFDNLQTEVTRMSAQVDKLNGRVEILEGAVESEKARNRTLVYYIDDLHRRWTLYRTEATPPPRPETT